MLELLVSGRVGHEEAVSVSGGEAADDPALTDTRVDHWDVVREFALENASNRNQNLLIGEDRRLTAPIVYL